MPNAEDKKRYQSIRVIHLETVKLTDCSLRKSLNPQPTLVYLFATYTNRYPDIKNIHMFYYSILALKHIENELGDNSISPTHPYIAKMFLRHNTLVS